MTLLKKILEKLNAPCSEGVGISISQDSKMEVVLFNTDLGKVKKYEKIEVKYNLATREINLEEFEAAVLGCFSKMEISSHIPVCLSVPNILTTKTSLPSDLEEVEVEVALSSEAEKYYLFKKTEPKISYIFVSSNKEELTSTYLYSVIQKDHSEKIQAVFTRNKFKLISIDVAFASFIRGLVSSGILDENMEKNFNWAVLIVSSTNFTINQFKGNKVINVYETAMALKSMDDDVLYPHISSGVSEKLGSEKLDNLYIISHTKDFSAEKLTRYIKLICNTCSIDNNKFNDKALFYYETQGNIESISPECVGAACWQKSKIKLDFNFTDIDISGELQGIFSRIGVKKPIHLYLVGGIVLTCLIIGLITLFCFLLNSFLLSQIQSSEQEFNKIKSLDVPARKVFDVADFVTKAFENNQNLLDNFDYLGACIPEKTWLTSINIDNKMNADINGKSYAVQDIIDYFNNLKLKTKFNSLKIREIKIVSNETETPKKEGSQSSKPAETQSPPNANQGGEIVLPEQKNGKISLPPPPAPPDTISLEGTPQDINISKFQKYYEFSFGTQIEQDKEQKPTNDWPSWIKNLIPPN